MSDAAGLRPRTLAAHGHFVSQFGCSAWDGIVASAAGSHSKVPGAPLRAARHRYADSLWDLGVPLSQVTDSCLLVSGVCAVSLSSHFGGDQHTFGYGLTSLQVRALGDVRNSLFVALAIRSLLPARSGRIAAYCQIQCIADASAFGESYIQVTANFLLVLGVPRRTSSTSAASCSPSGCC